MENDKHWLPSEKDYSPEISTELWLTLFKDKRIFKPNSFIILACLLDIGGEATCKQLSEKYGRHPTFYNLGNLGKRVHIATNCDLPLRRGIDEKYYPILCYGRYAKDGNFIYKLRPELKAALGKIDLSKIHLYKSQEDISRFSSGYNPLMDIIDGESITPYTKSHFLNEVYMDEVQYDSLVSLLKHKKNVILQGAPGVGKTFAAKRLAWSILGNKDEYKIKLVQFHQSYSYEDFIMGYKPDGNEYELKKGIFYEFCQKAENNPNHDYFFIIDEINRGNLSKIFGELLMMIEKDYRGEEITMAYDSDEKSFSVPKNLYIIGMMNTADRSLAMIDYALRRRFAFFDMPPAFENDRFKAYQQGLDSEKFNYLIQEIKKLNEYIKDSLGRGFCIGHSYFCGQSEYTDEWVKHIIEYEISPMLEEYWFDDEEKAREWTKKLHTILS